MEQEGREETMAIIQVRGTGGLDRRQGGRSRSGHFHNLVSNWSRKDLCRE